MSASSRRVFLIVEPDVLIAGDLGETLAAIEPRATIHVARDAAGALAVLERVERLCAAFLGMSARALRTDDLPRSIEARGGRVVVLDAAEDAAWARAAPAAGAVMERARPGEVRLDEAGWLYTGRPYAAHTIAAVLRRIG